MLCVIRTKANQRKIVHLENNNRNGQEKNKLRRLLKQDTPTKPKNFVIGFRNPGLASMIKNKLSLDWKPIMYDEDDDVHYHHNELFRISYSTTIDFVAPDSTVITPPTNPWIMEEKDHGLYIDKIHIDELVLSTMANANMCFAIPYMYTIQKDRMSLKTVAVMKQSRNDTRSTEGS